MEQERGDDGQGDSRKGRSRRIGRVSRLEKELREKSKSKKNSERKNSEKKNLRKNKIAYAIQNHGGGPKGDFVAASQHGGGTRGEEMKGGIRFSQELQFPKKEFNRR
jgi:hypothetical protein